MTTSLLYFIHTHSLWGGKVSVATITNNTLPIYTDVRVIWRPEESTPIIFHPVLLSLAETESEHPSTLSLHHHHHHHHHHHLPWRGEEEVRQNTSDTPLRVERERRGVLAIFSDQQRWWLLSGGADPIRLGVYHRHNKVTADKAALVRSLYAAGWNGKAQGAWGAAFNCSLYSTAITPIFRKEQDDLCHKIFLNQWLSDFWVMLHFKIH